MCLGGLRVFDLGCVLGFVLFVGDVFWVGYGWACFGLVLAVFSCFVFDWFRDVSDCLDGFLFIGLGWVGVLLYFIFCV